MNHNFVLTLSVPTGTFFNATDSDPHNCDGFDAFTDIMCGDHDHCTDACSDAHSSTGEGCFCANPCPWDWSGCEDDFTIFIPENMTPDEVVAMFAPTFPITVVSIQTIDEWEAEFNAEFPDIAAMF